MHGALGTALLFGGMVLGALAAVLALLLIRGNSEFTPGAWVFVGVAGVVAVPSLLVGVRLLRRGRSWNRTRRPTPR
jgi:hypothetical protein